MSHYEIRNIKTGETLVIVAPSSNSTNPASRAEESLARMERAGGKGKYEIVEVEK